MATKDPQTVTIYGRLSYPVFSIVDAQARNAKKVQYQKKPEDVAPEFNLLLEQPQLDKLVTHLKDVFLPWCLEQHTAGQKRSALDDKQIKKILVVLEDLSDQPPYLPVRELPEKTAELAPEAVATLKVNGTKGVDMVQKAIVNNEDELAVPDGNIIIPERGIIMPIRDTVHSLYGGCYAAATLNLYAYISSGLPGISASASTIVFKTDGDRFGGGVAVDEDDIFED